MLSNALAAVHTSGRTAQGSIEGVDGFCFTESYFTANSGRASSWSALLRAAKDPSASERGWDSLRRVCDRGTADVGRRVRLLTRLDAIVSVPSRKCRLQRRGMSLPDEFGRALHDSQGFRYEPDALVSAVDHIEIKRIAIEGRRQAVKGTFAANTSKLAGKSVLLVDDISTSGATLAECAGQLRNAGVGAVFAYTLGRTAHLCSLFGSDETEVHKVALVDPPCEFDRWTRNVEPPVR